jgi:hypothetical protein
MSRRDARVLELDDGGERVAMFCHACQLEAAGAPALETLRVVPPGPA